MITINKNIQSEILMTTMEEIVPQDSLFRKIDKYIDFTFIYNEVKDLYCDNNGRPSIDPVVLFKIVFIQALDGIKSMRQTCKKIRIIICIYNCSQTVDKVNSVNSLFILLKMLYN